MNKQKIKIIIIGILFLFVVPQFSYASSLYSQEVLDSYVNLSYDNSGSPRIEDVTQILNENNNGMSGTVYSFTIYTPNTNWNDIRSHLQSNQIAPPFLRSCTTKYATSTTDGSYCSGSSSISYATTTAPTQNGNYWTFYLNTPLVLNPAYYYEINSQLRLTYSSYTHSWSGTFAGTCNFSYHDKQTGLQTYCPSGIRNLMWSLNGSAGYVPSGSTGGIFATTTLSKILSLSSPTYQNSPYATTSPITFTFNSYIADPPARNFVPCVAIRKLSSSFLTVENHNVTAFCGDSVLSSGTSIKSIDWTPADYLTYLDSGVSYGAFPYLGDKDASSTPAFNETLTYYVPFAIGTMPDDLQGFYEEITGTATSSQGWSCNVDLIVTGFDVCETTQYLFIPTREDMKSAFYELDAQFKSRIPFSYIANMQDVFMVFATTTGSTTAPSLKVTLWKNVPAIELLGTSTATFYPDAVRLPLRALMVALLWVAFGFAIFNLRNKLFK